MTVSTPINRKSISAWHPYANEREWWDAQFKEASEGIAEEDIQPRVVNLTHVAFTGFCTECGGQFDIIYPRKCLNWLGLQTILNWNTVRRVCDVCRPMYVARINALPDDSDTEDEENEEQSNG